MKTDELIGLLARDLPTATQRPQPIFWRWVPAGALAAGCVFLLFFGLRENILSTPVLQITAVKFGLGAALAAAAGFGAMRLSRPEAKPTLPLIAIGLVVAALFAMLWRDAGSSGMPAPRWTSIMRCVTFIPLMALPALAGFLMAMRAGAVTRPGLAGAFAGIASGGLAILFYGLNCTEDSILFLSAWYTAGVALAALVGSLAARRILVW